MIELFRVSKRLARPLTFCLVIWTSAVPAQSTVLQTWQDTRSLQELISHLEDWLDKHTDLQRREAAPVVKWTSKASVTSITGSKRSVYVKTVRGLYDGESLTVWLVRPWSAHDPSDVSVLLHELVHHRQAGNGHWYCPGAQELPAYRIQQAWLAELGLELDVNWVAIVLEAGCTPRDIHPD